MINDRPKKNREIQSHHFDSTIWNDFAFRPDDIFIATYAKSGTTWMQQIISQLIFNGQTDLAVAEMSPWVDLRIPPKHIKLAELEAQTHRRFLKTHLPVDALVFSEQAKYLYIGRDGRDVLWSLYHHHKMANESWYDALNNTPGRVGPPIERPNSSVTQYYRDWLEKDGFPWWSFWENIRSWWKIKDLPNVHLVHFANLKKDMSGEIRKMADFLDIPIDEGKWSDILRHCGFDYMKQHAEQTVPLGGTFWEGGARTFINKGTNGRWNDVLSKEEIALYESKAAMELEPECVHWLASGNFQSQPG